MDAAEELRIIASEGGRLDNADCEMLRAAADELERTERMLIATREALLASSHHRIALTEALTELKGKATVSFAIPDWWRVHWSHEQPWQSQPYLLPSRCRPLAGRIATT